jgi:hypothetical protein
MQCIRRCQKKSKLLKENKMLAKISAWYDSLKEPKRFFVFIVLVFGFYVPYAIAMILADFMIGIEYMTAIALLIIVGSLQLAFLFTLAIYRAFGK